MKKLLKRIGYAVLVLAAVVAGAALYVHLAGIPRYAPPRVQFEVDSTPERVVRGRRTAMMLCVACHQDPATGALTGRRMAGLPALFGEVYSTNITQDPTFGIGAWTDGELAYLIRTGVARDGRYTPPWMVKLPRLADEELRDIIAFLRSDDPMVRPAPVPDRDTVPSFVAKVMTRLAFKPLPYPAGPIVAPPPSERVAYGRYLLTAKLRCHECHSRDVMSVDLVHPERSKGYLGGGYAVTDPSGRRLYSTNLTPDAETGLGRWTEAEFRRTLKLGIRPDGRPLRRPMTARPDLTDDEIGAMWAYLRSVPPLRNRVPDAEPLEVTLSSSGRAVSGPTRRVSSGGARR